MVEFSCVFVEKVDPLGRRGGDKIQQVVCCGDPFRERECKCANRPVAAPHETLPAEGFNHMKEPGKDSGSRALLLSGVEEEAGDLAGHIRAFGQVANLSAPEIHRMRRHVRHSTVIEDKLRLRAGIDQRDGDRKLSLQDAEIEREFSLRERCDVLSEN